MEFDKYFFITLFINLGLVINVSLIKYIEAILFKISEDV